MADRRLERCDRFLPGAEKLQNGGQLELDGDSHRERFLRGVRNGGGETQTSFEVPACRDRVSEAPKRPSNGKVRNRE